MIPLQDINRYSDLMTEDEPTYLKELERETNLKSIYPRMLSGKLQGRFLSFISKMLKPNRILEIGSFTGYAALCMAEGLSEEGELHTLERNAELKTILEKAISNSPYSNKIKVIWGDAEQSMMNLTETYDLVFLDADKINYQTYYELAIELLSEGGVIIADNVLWSGKVIDEKEKDADTKALRDFNQAVKKDPRVEQVLLPIRDGLLMIRKK